MSRVPFWASAREGGLAFLLSLLVTIVALFVAMLCILAAGVSLNSGASAFFTGAFGTQINFASTLATMVPLTLVALGWIVAYRAGRFQVGFPGQILVGGLVVSVVALKLSVPIAIHLPLVLLAGMLGGAAWAGIAAWLWAKRGVNEILSTLLLNLVAVQLLAWWVRGPFHDPETPLPVTRSIPTSAQWPFLIKDTSLHWDIVLLAVVIVISYVLSRTSFGFQVRLVGANEEAARHSGVSPTRVGARALLLSGALAGLAGSSLVVASTTQVMGEDVGSGLGYTGIAVALLARNNPWGVIPAALLFSSLVQGSSQMQATIGVSPALSDFIQGLMVVLVLGATTLLYFARRHRQGRPPRHRGADARAAVGREVEVASS
jgi:general nucleoside transport system permease protein